MVYADEIDRASAIEEAQTQAYIDEARVLRKRHPKDPGHCDWCGESSREDGTEMTTEHLFCSQDCRDSDAHATMMKARLGRP